MTADREGRACILDLLSKFDSAPDDGPTVAVRRLSVPTESALQNFEGGLSMVEAFEAWEIIFDPAAREGDMDITSDGTRCSMTLSYEAIPDLRYGVQSIGVHEEWEMCGEDRDGPWLNFWWDPSERPPAPGDTSTAT